LSPDLYLTLIINLKEMKRNFLSAILLALLSVGFVSCGQKTKSDSQAAVNTIDDVTRYSQNSLDWKGTYSGVIPCADCDGIRVQITLNDNTYQMSYQYLGTKEATPEQFSGKFAWDESSNIVTLDHKEIPPYYRVDENKLIQLDMEGNEITGELAEMYVLIKDTDF
jgi:uncharacterized lipoprotein NlpE involved in copper resistance